VGYDKNGNVTGLTRKGHLDIGGTTFGNMDVLGYVYDSGNKVLRIDDSGSDAQGFRDGTNVNDDFEYDGNGNLKVDRNKGITSITYNHLNMPTLVDFGATGNIEMVYAADGTKLKKTASNGTVTEYANGYIYENNTLQFFDHPEGYIMPDNGGWRYVYQYKDQVGNIRLSYTDNNGTLEIVEENNYYPFGGKMRGYNSNVSSFGNSTAQRWKFGGKEQDDSLNGAMGTYDFGARIYDEWGVRWWNIDPLAEQMRRHSPYNYAFNNPISFVDPDGMKPWWINNGDGTWTAEAGDSAATLAEDAGISLDQANKIVESQLGENYIGEDGELKSDVEVGDVVEFDVIKGDHTLVVVPDDSGTTETDTNDIDFGSTQDGNANKKAETAAAATIMISALELANPEGELKNKAIDVVSKSVFKHLTKVKNVKGIIRTTSPTPLSTPTTNSTETVPVKGHWRTLKNGKKVWVKPHTRTIKKSKNKSE